MTYRRIQPERRTKTVSFKVTPTEDAMIKKEVARRKLTSISEFLEIVIFENIGKKL